MLVICLDFHRMPLASVKICINNINNITWLEVLSVQILSIHRTNVSKIVLSSKNPHTFFKLIAAVLSTSRVKVPQHCPYKKSFCFKTVVSSGLDIWQVSGRLLIKPSAQTALVTSSSSVLSVFKQLVYGSLCTCDHRLIYPTKNKGHLEDEIPNVYACHSYGTLFFSTQLAIQFFKFICTTKELFFSLSDIMLSGISVSAHKIMSV